MFFKLLKEKLFFKDSKRNQKEINLIEYKLAAKDVEIKEEKMKLEIRF
jgi:hypothetical protein